MNWPRIARRIRVPLGFALAVVFLWLAAPTLISLALGLPLILAGLALRAAASGHVRKDAELTTTGPYRYTRNPLYLGSLLIAVGFALAARNWWIAALLVILFFVIYLPVIRSEEDFLRQHFPGFTDYERDVPRLLPRVPARSTGAGAFSRALYLQHREYNAAIGAVALLAALLVKLLWL